jgi:hypothetical protein
LLLASSLPHGSMAPVSLPAWEPEFEKEERRQR